MGTLARTLVGLSVLMTCAPRVHAQCDYRDNLVPLESFEGLTPERIEALQALRDAIAAADEQVDERTEILSREENQRIRAVLEGNSEQIFFLRIFGGYMPVPNRYVVSGPGAFRAYAIRPAGPQDSLQLHGTMTFGPRSELTRFSVDDPEPCEKAEFTRHGLNVEMRRYQDVRWVAIYNDSEFLTIIDTNLSLWEAMLDVWYELGR